MDRIMSLASDVGRGVAAVSTSLEEAAGSVDAPAWLQLESLRTKVSTYEYVHFEFTRMPRDRRTCALS